MRVCESQLSFAATTALIRALDGVPQLTLLDLSGNALGERIVYFAVAPWHIGAGCDYGVWAIGTDDGGGVVGLMVAILELQAFDVSARQHARDVVRSGQRP